MQHQGRVFGRFGFAVFLLVACSLVDAHDLCLNSNDTIINNATATTCELDEVTTVDEQIAILADVCAGNLNRSHSDLVLVPTVQHHRNIDAGASLTDHCAGRTQGFLKWVTWSFYEQYMHEPLNFMEKYLDRRVNATNATDVLIEVLPIRYELHDVQPSGARSLQIVRAVELGALELANNDTNGSAILYGKIPYAFERLLSIQVVSADDDHLIAGLSVRIANGSTNAEKLPDLIYGHRVKKLERETYVFSKELSAAKHSTAKLHGSWAVQEYNVTATLVSIYAPNVNRSNPITAKVLDTVITHVHVTFSTDTARLAAKAPSFISLPDGRRPVVFNESHQSSSDGGKRLREELYPGFRPYFYLACIVLFGTMFVVFTDVGRKLCEDRNRSKDRALETDGGELLIAERK